MSSRPPSGRPSKTLLSNYLREQPNYEMKGSGFDVQHLDKFVQFYETVQPEVADETIQTDTHKS